MPETSGPICVLLVLRQVDCNDGVTAYCESLVQGLCERGHRVVILSGPVTTFFGSQTRYESIRARVEDWIVLDDVVSFSALPRAARAVAAAVRRHGVDVISPQGLSMLPLAATAGRLTGRPVVANRHLAMSGWDSGSQQGLRARMFRWAFSRLFTAERYIAISQEIRERYRSFYGVPDERIVVIPNGIDTTTYYPCLPVEREAARRSLDIPERHLVCSLVGRLNFVKGHDVLIDAARRVAQQRPDIAMTFLFAGGGDQEAEIRAYAHRNERDVATFRFLGFLDAASLREVYRATDILALPSRNEGFGIVVAEAMACGCVPVRTHGAGSSEQVIEGETGFAIDEDDSDALAARIVDLADPQTRGRMSAAAARLATTSFGRGQMVENILAVYRSVLR